LAEHEPDLRAKTASDPELVRVVDEALRQIAAAEKTAATRRHEPRFVGFRGSELLSIAAASSSTRLRLANPTTCGSRSSLTRISTRCRTSCSRRLQSMPTSRKPRWRTARRSPAATRADHPFVRAALGGREPSDVARTPSQERGWPTWMSAGRSSRRVGSGRRLGRLDGHAGPSARPGGPRRTKMARGRGRCCPDARRRKALAGAMEGLWQDRPARCHLHPSAQLGRGEGVPGPGTQVPPRTTFHGLYDRSIAFGNQPPWDLPPRFLERKAQLDLTTPLTSSRPTTSSAAIQAAPSSTATASSSGSSSTATSRARMGLPLRRDPGPGGLG